MKLVISIYNATGNIDSIGTVPSVDLSLIKFVLQCNHYRSIQFHGLGMCTWDSLICKMWRAYKLAYCRNRVIIVNTFQTLVCVLINSTISMKSLFFNIHFFSFYNTEKFIWHFDVYFALGQFVQRKNWHCAGLVKWPVICHYKACMPSIHWKCSKRFHPTNANPKLISIHF